MSDDDGPTAMDVVDHEAEEALKEQDSKMDQGGEGAEHEVGLACSLQPCPRSHVCSDMGCGSWIIVCCRRLWVPRWSTKLHEQMCCTRSQTRNPTKLYGRS